MPTGLLTGGVTPSAKCHGGAGKLGVMQSLNFKTLVQMFLRFCVPSGQWPGWARSNPSPVCADGPARCGLVQHFPVTRTRINHPPNIGVCRRTVILNRHIPAASNAKSTPRRVSTAATAARGAGVSLQPTLPDLRGFDVSASPTRWERWNLVFAQFTRSLPHSRAIGAPHDPAMCD